MNLKTQAMFYGTMALGSIILILSSMLIFKDVMLTFYGIMLFAFVWPLTVVASGGYLLMKTVETGGLLKNPMETEDDPDLDQVMDMAQNIQESFKEEENEE